MAEITDEQRENGQALDAVVSAAKIAAVSAAVGAAAAAAKAFASRHDHDEDEPVDEQPDEEPRDEVPEPPDEELQDEIEQEPEPEPEAQEDEDADEDEQEPVEGAALGEASNAAMRGRKQLEELLGKPVESVSSLERTHDGWVAALEVIELSRIPESTDVLASYEIELDEELNFRRYQQVRRYTRSQADSGDQ
jgi:Gas vesicle synthesis protein GvpO